MFQFQVLLPPVLAMMSLAFLLSTVMRQFHAKQYEQLAFGCVFGGVMVFGMTNPIQIDEGLIFDMRTLLAGAATVFVGPLAGFIAVMFGIAARVYIGGSGMLTGVVGLLLALGLALIWRQLLAKRVKTAIAHDIGLGGFLTLSANALFILPSDIALPLVAAVAPVLLIGNTLGIIAIGYVFRRESAYFSERETMQSQAQTDALTTLLNRRGMETAVKFAKFDPSQGHAILYFDVDNFKAINDRYGHDVGDAALAIIAARLKVIIRDGAIFARQGGDEFSVYFPMLGRGDVQGIADRFCAAISGQKFRHSDALFFVSITIGGFWSKSMMPIDQMARRADAELLLAKTAGKNRVRIAYGHLEDEAIPA